MQSLGLWCAISMNFHALPVYTHQHCMFVYTFTRDSVPSISDESILNEHLSISRRCYMHKEFVLTSNE